MGRELPVWIAVVLGGLVGVVVAAAALVYLAGRYSFSAAERELRAAEAEYYGAVSDRHQRADELERAGVARGGFYPQTRYGHDPKWRAADDTAYNAAGKIHYLTHRHPGLRTTVRAQE